MQLPLLGLGLIGIGRAWGHSPQPPSSEAEARALLDAAFAQGIAFYDTAPAYGSSEERLGSFLRTLRQEERERIFVATKFGEHWNDDGTTRVDHSYEALMRSLDRSVERLRDIDLLQVHKASVEALRGDDLKWAIEAARAMEIPRFGASVSDVEAGRLAIAMGFDAIQFPLNAANPALAELAKEAEAAGVQVIANRPLASGALLAAADPAARATALSEAFAAVLTLAPRAVVLTGTRLPDHLRQSQAAFDAACSRLPEP